MNYRLITFIDKLICFTGILLLPLLLTSFTSGLTIKTISSNDGLSNSAISVIYRDSTGIMWFGTWDGLNSYDGKDIRVFKSDKKNPKTITSNVIINIVEPKKGILWVSTTNGVNRLNTDTKESRRFFEAESKNASTSSKSYKLALGPANLVLCYTLKNQLNYYDEKLQQFVPIEIPSLQQKKISEFVSDTQGTLFAITNDGEIYRIQLKVFQKKVVDVISCIRILPQFIAGGIFHKSENEFWITDKNQRYIYLYNSSNGIFKESAELKGFPIKGSIQTINEFNNEIVVGLATTGLFYYDVIRKSWVRIQNAEFQGGVLSSFYDRRQQIFWIGTNSNGVIESYNEQLNFKCIPNKKLSEQHASAVRAICEDDQGRIWVGSRGNGLSIISQTRDGADKVINIAGFNNKSILSITKGPDNIMIIGSEADGIYTVNEKTLQVGRIDLHILPNLSGTNPAPVYDLYWDAINSVLWIGSNTDGAFQLKMKLENRKLRVESFYSYNKENNSGIKNNNVYSIIPFDSQHILMSTRGAGIYLVNIFNHRIITNINQDSPSPLTDNDVLCLSKSQDGSCWAGTSYGLNHLIFNGKRITVHHYTEQNGLQNNTVHGILEDSNGTIWISTNNGLSKINPKTNQITNYNHGYGLQSNEFSDGAYFKTSKGELYFGGINGLNHFFTSEFEERSFIPNIIINNIRINNTSYPLSLLLKKDNNGNYLSLKYDQNFFTVNFIALDYINNSNCEYSYILEGFNNDWVTSGTSNNAVFTNVNPGEYTLKIKATNGDKIWSNNYFTLRIRVEKPWWNSWLAYFIYLTIIGIAVYYVYSTIRKRIQLNRTIFEERVAKKEQLVTYEAKLRFFTNIAHEFCTPLTLIYGHSEKLLSTNDIQSSTKKYLYIIKNNAERMQRLINDLMDFRKMETDNKKVVFEIIDIHELAKYISDNFTEFSEQKQITFELNFLTGNHNFISDRDALEKIFFNLVSNAYKYTNEGGNIRINIENADNQLRFMIRNTGPGIKPVDIPDIFNRFQILDNFERNAGKGNIQRNGIGLALTKSLVKLLDGNISVESIENEYTVFTVILPAKKNVELSTNILTETDSETDIELPVLANDKKPLIMIVDDEAEIRVLLKEILSPNYEIIETTDGLKAIESLRIHRPDLIISDILMPNMNGIELLNEIKSSRLTSHIPVIFLSSKSTIDEQIASYDRGLEFFIAKPFNPKYLISVVSRIIHNRDSLKQYFNSSLSSIEEFNGNFVHSDEKNFMISIVEIIKNNMENEQLGADFICNQMNITRILLYRRIKEIANTTPTEFIRNIRLKEAERLIRTTKFTIQEIMFQTGFNNKSYFYSIFKSEYGISPNEYRKTKGNE